MAFRGIIRCAFFQAENGQDNREDSSHDGFFSAASGLRDQGDAAVFGAGGNVASANLWEMFGEVGASF